jgi:hypothetical protein
MLYMKKGTISLIKECCIPTKEWTSDFEIAFSPQKYAEYAGIYQCEVCNLKIVHPGKSDLPPHNYDKDTHRHKWRLLISLTEPIMVSVDSSLVL